MAKPSTLPLGRADPHILQSRGAETSIMNFYVTSYSSGFTKPNIDYNKGRNDDIPVYSGGPIFKPRSAPENHKTGYIANVRPQIYYRKTLDEFDNPEMGRSCAENYDTTTNLHFQPYRVLDGNEELPVQVVGQTSSYTQNAYDHNPRPSDVHKNYIDTKIRAPYDVLPNHRTKLDKLNNHDPVRNENFGYGPNYMSTEYFTRYEGKQRPNILDKNHSSIGPKELSGFVENKLYEDAITAVPGERWLNRDRSIGNTVYKDKFLPYSFAKSETQLPNISKLSSTKNSTFSKAYLPSDINPKNDNYKNITETKESYIIRPKETKLSEKLGTSFIGNVNETAQTLCEKGFVQTLDDSRRFISNYQLKHYDMNAKGKDREGYVTGGVYGPLENGYTLNVRTHNTGDLNVNSILKNMDSYQSRSIRANDNFYDDHTHDNKLTTKASNVLIY